MLIETDRNLSTVILWNNNIIFLPHWGSSFGFIAVTFLLITCRCVRAPSSAVCEVVEAGMEIISKNCACKCHFGPSRS